ncbi:GntR family transcriptional regulator [Martelella alba]|uniref:GntR family transcriptional regulator n=1 Tax=Martelella alba TaxID=2590451 RepID=A0A506UIX8_9HYPH|nr:GntR family transcriptional regulator [Martelella alba]TPW33279.1 GntR family transcriptional regulator [Martelella alba]
MDFRVDRSLPMSVRQQLKGAIEFAIAFGELVAGDALPSVREMATAAGVAVMTVSQVYRELKEEGLIETRPGAGTFIADSSKARAAQHPDIEALHRQIDAIIAQAEKLGVGDADLTALLKARLAYRSKTGTKLHIVMAGLFPDATLSYAKAIFDQLGGAVVVEPVTIRALNGDAQKRAHAASADYVVTFTNRRRELAALMPTAKIISIRFIPSETTRMALASISPTARLLVLSQFPDFLPIFQSAMRRFAAHVGKVVAVNFDDPRVPELLAASDVVVYATGTEDTAEKAPQGTSMFEYRHVPDPADVDRVLLPLVSGEPVPVGATGGSKTVVEP